MYGYKMSLRQDPNPAKPKSSLSTRALKLRWRNLRMAHTLLREKYRKKFGIDPDRRSRRIICQAGSSPDASAARVGAFPE